MYCKHCGKQITDDSVYCQYCGGELDSSAVDSNKVKKEIEIPNIKLALSDQTKKKLYIYAVWILLNFICLLLEGTNSHSNQYFFPIDKGDFIYYDITEFLIYTLIIPAIIFAVFKWFKKWKSN